ncbi:hypothetical protein ACL02R_01290 [Streptomyces sp. MS19]|uniref:hypothetical protein n=1 Tax=Streptomyces sp. MS19 TaxID=3385972 RepID=UPI0039A3D935
MSLIDRTPRTDSTPETDTRTDTGRDPGRTGITEISRHMTAEGVTLWLRCSCGRLRMVFTPDSPLDRPLFAGGRTPGCPDCG